MDGLPVRSAAGHVDTVGGDRRRDCPRPCVCGTGRLGTSIYNAVDGRIVVTMVNERGCLFAFRAFMFL